jgi:hypothetical protein
MNHKSSFVYDSLDMSKYSPKKGFGKKTALKNDEHTSKLDQNIDNMLE